MKKLITILLTGFATLAFTACGGSSSSDTEENISPTVRTGGSMDEPVQLTADGRTYITTYDSKSYFIYTAKKDENILMKITLERYYTDSEKEEYIHSDMTEEELETLLSEMKLVQHTPTTLDTPDKISAEMVKVREQGYAFDDEDN